jgi:hypothetical protein
VLLELGAQQLNNRPFKTASHLFIQLPHSSCTSAATMEDVEQVGHSAQLVISQQPLLNKYFPVLFDL